MKIGIMLRHFNQHGGGVKNYTNYLLDELFKLNSEHEFFLIYNNPKFIGTYNHHENVNEISIKISSKLLWDQIGVPWIHRKEKFDIIFNPKYSVPFLSSCPKVFVCHGLNSYLMPWGTKFLDRIYRKYIYPRYASVATSIIAVSNSTKKNLIDFLNVEKERIHTIHLGIHELYRQKIEEKKLESIKKEYKLPDKFFLYAGQIYPPKNFGRLLMAYSKVGPKLGIYLVVAGEHRWLCDEELEMVEKLGLSKWVIRPGWIKHSTLRHFFALADALLLPSLYEACPSPILEAMATGCPVVTSNRFGTEELAGDAAVLVDPEDIESIASGMENIAVNQQLRNELIKKGYERSNSFSWSKCAKMTLNVLEESAKIPKIKSKSVKVFKLKKKHKHLIIKPPAKLINVLILLINFLN